MTVTEGGQLYDRLRELVGATGRPQAARHPVGTTAIADWCDAMGDTNPCYTDPQFAAASVHGGLVAPPAMLDVWDRGGLTATIPPDDPRARALDLLAAEGFVAVVAVNSELEVRRYLRLGEVLSNVQLLDDVSPLKRTALGEGHFVTTRHRYTTGDGENVGDLLFRILKFRPGTGRVAEAAGGDDSRCAAPDPDPALRPRPAVNRDNAMLWEGYRRHELRIPRCTACGRLELPPSPRCSACGAFAPGWLVASGRGSLYSFAVPHHPRVPGFRYPLPVGLVELEEGVRLVAGIVGCERDDLRIGMPLEVEWLDTRQPLPDGAGLPGATVTLPQFRPAPPAPRASTLPAGEVAAGASLPLLSVPVTTTLIVSGALATRDFTEVHHDRDHAVARGSADVFMNINTSLGLLQRHVTDWAGPEALVTALRARLGVPAYPGDHLAFTGAVTAADPASGAVSVGVQARNRLGVHLTGTVELVLPGGRRYDDAVRAGRG